MKVSVKMSERTYGAYETQTYRVGVYRWRNAITLCFRYGDSRTESAELNIESDVAKRIGLALLGASERKGYRDTLSVEGGRLVTKALTGGRFTIDELVEALSNFLLGETAL